MSSEPVWIKDPSANIRLHCFSPQSKICLFFVDVSGGICRRSSRGKRKNHNILQVLVYKRALAAPFVFDADIDTYFF